MIQNGGRAVRLCLSIQNRNGIHLGSAFVAGQVRHFSRPGITRPRQKKKREHPNKKRGPRRTNEEHWCYVNQKWTYGKPDSRPTRTHSREMALRHLTLREREKIEEDERNGIVNPFLPEAWGRPPTKVPRVEVSSVE